MTGPGVRRQPSRWTSVAAGIGAVALATMALALVGWGLAFVADLLLT